MTEPTHVPGAPSPEELDAKGENAFEAALLNIAAKTEERVMGRIFDKLAKFETVDRSEVPAVPRREPEYVTRGGDTVLKTRLATDVFYRHFSEQEREFRFPEADHWAAEWIRGRSQNDNAQMQLAEAKMRGIFPELYRADTLQGAPGAAGAFGAGTGATLLPRPLEMVVMIARDRVAKMRRFATNLTMTTQTHNVPTAAAMTASMVGEGSTATGGEPAFAQVQLSARKGQVTATASIEMLADAAVNLTSLYATRAGGALGVLEDSQFFEDGDGTGNNISLRITGTTHTLAAPTVLAYDDVVDMYFAVPQEYRSGAVWMGASDVLGFLTKVVDGVNGRPFYAGLQERPPPQTDDDTTEGSILRKPVIEVALPAGEILFGNVAACYTVGTRQGITTAMSEHVKFDSDLIMWKFTQRFDGNDVDPIAVQRATGITSATP